MESGEFHEDALTVQPDLSVAVDDFAQEVLPTALLCISPPPGSFPAARGGNDQVRFFPFAESGIAEASLSPGAENYRTSGFGYPTNDVRERNGEKCGWQRGRRTKGHLRGETETGKEGARSW